MYVQVVVEGGVLEVDLAVPQCQASWHNPLGDLIKKGECQHLTVLAGELAQYSVVVLGIHPPKKRKEDDVLVTALLEALVLEHLAALERLTALVAPRTELIEGAGTEQEHQKQGQLAPHSSGDPGLGGVLAHEGHVGHVLLNAARSLDHDRRAGLLNDRRQQIEGHQAVSKVGVPVPARIKGVS